MATPDENIHAQIDTHKAHLHNALHRQYDAEGNIRKHMSLLEAANRSIGEHEEALRRLTGGNWSQEDTNALKPTPHVPVQN